jgi:membrane peptidoglycan carboxypeptidase
MGVTRVDGTSLLQKDVIKSGRRTVTLDPADDIPSFTLGSVDVSPMSMAAAYAVPAANGIYCSPIVLTKIVNDDGKSLPVPSASCHRAIPVRVAQAVNYILQGVLVNGTAQGGELANYPAAGKTGTSNVESGNGTPYAAFAGYTTKLVGYVSVFNPKSPTQDPMVDESACYRQEGGGQHCFGEMFGANAPLSVWHTTFDHANLSGSTAFDPVPQGSSLWNAGNGQSVKQPKKAKKGGKGGANGGNNPGNGGGNTPGNGGGTGGNGPGGFGGTTTAPTVTPATP